MAQKVYLNLQANISQDVATKLITAIEDNLRKGMSELHLLMASPGGSVDPGMAIYNLLRGIPVIAVTASAMTQDRRQILAAGFDGYQAKPISVKGFLQAVREMLPS